MESPPFIVMWWIAAGSVIPLFVSAALLLKRLRSTEVVTSNYSGPDIAEMGLVRPFGVLQLLRFIASGHHRELGDRTTSLLVWIFRIFFVIAAPIHFYAHYSLWRGV